MQRRFIKIDSAENLYNETQLALEQISLTWSDIYFIKVKGELVSVENFRTFAEDIDFDPFSDSKKTDNINICFNNGSMLVRSSDKNFRKCYCFYDVTQSELTPAEIEQKYGKNYIKINLKPNIFERTISGKDSEDFFIDTRNMVEGEVYSIDSLIDKNRLEFDGNAFSKILEERRGEIINKKEETNFSAKGSSLKSIKSNNVEDMIREIKDSMSEEDAEKIDENELRKTLLKGIKGDDIPVWATSTGKPIERHAFSYVDENGNNQTLFIDDEEQHVESNKEFVGFYPMGGEVDTISYKDIVNDSEKEITLSEFEEGYRTKRYYYKKKVDYYTCYFRQKPKKIITGIFLVGGHIFDEGTEQEHEKYMLEDTYLDLYVRAKMGDKEAIKQIRDLIKRRKDGKFMVLSRAYKVKEVIKRTEYSGTYVSTSSSL